MLGQVEGAGRILPSPELLSYATLALESIASSRIEGTVASPDELVLFQLEPSGQSERVREVGNYNNAVQYGVSDVADRPVTLNFILELHAILMTNVRGAKHAGRLKTAQNFIGQRPGDTIEDAIYVPPPPEATPGLVSDFEKYLNMPQSEPALVKHALAHYQFEAIHPFGDGNGRIGRLLIVLGLIQDGLISSPIVYPSVYFDRNRDEYFRLLKEIQQNSAWQEWIDFFLRAIIEQSRSALALIDEISKLRIEVQRSIHGVRRSASAARVIDAFFAHPVRTVSEVASHAGVAVNTARSAVEELVEQHVLREVTGRKSHRAYVCEPIWRAIFK